MRFSIFSLIAFASLALATPIPDSQGTWSRRKTGGYQAHNLI